MSKMTATATPKAIQYAVLLRRATVVVVVVEAATGVSMTGVAIAVSIGGWWEGVFFLLFLLGCDWRQRGAAVGRGGARVEN